MGSGREERFERVTRLAQQLFGVPTAAVNLVDQDRQYNKAISGGSIPLVIPRSQSLCGHTVQNDDALVVSDAREDLRFKDLAAVRSGDVIFYAGQPLRAPSGERVGSLCIVDRRPRTVTHTQLELLKDLTAWVEKELAVDEELFRAGEIQRLLLPSGQLSIPGWDVAGHYVPMGELGGDFFDYLVNNGDLVVTLADVMGKGLGASLIASGVRAVLRGTVRLNELGTGLSRAADALYDDLTQTGSLVTAFVARFCSGTGRLTFVDAGHGLAGIVTACGNLHHLHGTDVPFGVLPDVSYAVGEAVIQPGDTFVTVSDGLLDHFETPRAAVMALAAAVQDAPTAQAAASAVGRLADPRLARDDLTVVVVRRGPLPVTP